MTAATLEAPASSSTSSATKRSNGSRDRRPQRSRQQLESSFVSTEIAVSELVRGSVTMWRSALPSVVTRPTDAVEYVFDLAEQGLAATRRFAYEIAAVFEAGFDAVDRDAA